MRLETLVLLCNPGAVRQLELGFALGQRFSSAGTLQLGKLLGRQDDGINTAVFFNKHRLGFGQGAHGAKTVFGLGGGDMHVRSPECIDGYFSHYTEGQLAPANVSQMA
jgi:hypothetical protein